MFARLWNAMSKKRKEEKMEDEAPIAAPPPPDPPKLIDLCADETDRQAARVAPIIVKQVPRFSIAGAELVVKELVRDAIERVLDPAVAAERGKAEESASLAKGTVLGGAPSPAPSSS